MHETKSALLKLITVYVLFVACILMLTMAISLFTGGFTGRNGLPVPVAILITVGAAVISFGFFVCIGIGIAVFHDAKKRNMEPWLWALVAALVPYFLGLIAYLIARKPADTFCSACGGTVPERSVFCPQCGHSLQRACPGCSRPASPSTRFCPHCGTQLAPPGSDV